MKEFLKDYFYYTRTERNGIIVLSVLSLFFFGARYGMDFMITPKRTNFTEIQKALDAIPKSQQADAQVVELFQFNPNEATLDDLMRLGLKEKLATTIIHYRDKGGKFKSEKDFQKMWGLSPSDFERLSPYLVFDAVADAKPSWRNEKKAPVLVPFNPQTVSKEEFVALGLDEKLADRIINYRNKGGQFRKKEDLQKMYGLKPEQYLQLEPYIVLTPIAAPQYANKTDANGTLPNTYVNTNKPYAPKIVNIDVNLGAQEDWEKLRGIGPSFATRIIKYRDNLGGFANVEQLKEVYGLQDSTFQKIKPSLQISPILRKLHVNNVAVNELRHPYIRYTDAKLIINYREQHGAFKSAEDLKKVIGVPATTVDKMIPYLAFD